MGRQKRTLKRNDAGRAHGIVNGALPTRSRDIEEAKALAFLEKSLSSPDATVRSGAAYALGGVGGEKALALLEKALADQNDRVRLGAVSGLGNVDGDKARAVMLNRLAVEKDQNVLMVLSSSLRAHYAGDPALEKALKEAEARLPK